MDGSKSGIPSKSNPIIFITNLYVSFLTIKFIQTKHLKPNPSLELQQTW